MYLVISADLFMDQKTIEKLYAKDFHALRLIIRHSVDSMMHEKWYKHSSYVSFFSSLSSWVVKQIHKNNLILNPQRKRSDDMTEDQRALVEWKSDSKNEAKDSLDRAKYRFFELKHEKSRKHKRKIVLRFLKRMGFAFIDYDNEGVRITSWSPPKDIAYDRNFIDFFIYLAGAEIYYNRDESKDYLPDPTVTYCSSLKPDHDSTTIVVPRNEDISSHIDFQYLDEETWEGVDITKKERSTVLPNIFQARFHLSRDSTILNENGSLNSENVKLKNKIKELEETVSLYEKDQP